MIKANQWLLDNGFIQAITRGRRSAENNLRLHEAYESGIRFTDWEPRETVDSKGNYATKNATPPTSEAKVIADIKYTYPEADWEATAKVNGKTVSVGMREVCSNCYMTAGINVSLVAHYCDSPSVSTILGYDRPVKVDIIPRKTPLPAIQW